jgi:hypothetical protein
VASVTTRTADPKSATTGRSAVSTKRRRRSAAPVPHLSVEERVARGKAARKEVPRARHAVFVPLPTRADPVALLERQAKARVSELVPIRYGRMLVSPFTFYRGAAMIMAHDLAATPRSGLTVQCCGDAHLSNFGVFASPERRLVFDVGRYRIAMAGFAGMSNLEVWYSRLEIESVIAELGSQVKPRRVKRAQKQLAKARTKDSITAFSKLTEMVGGKPRSSTNRR